MSEANWYYLQHGQTCGPVDLRTLKWLLAMGNLPWFEYVWSANLQEWTQASQVLDLIGIETGDFLEESAEEPEDADVSAPPVDFDQSMIPAATIALAAPPLMNYYRGRPTRSRVVYAGFWLR